MGTKKKKHSSKEKEGRIQEKRRKKRSKLYTKIFYSVYALTIVALFIGMMWASRYLNDYVKAYEASQPKYAAEAAFRPFAERNYDVLSQVADQDIFRYESRVEYDAYMDRMLGGRAITYNEVYSADENEKRYVVKADGNRFGEFTLRCMGTDDYGFRQWSFSSMSIVSPQSSTYTVDVPTGTKVFVNGQRLDDENLVQWDIPEFDDIPALPEGSKVPTRCVYQFKRYFAVPLVSATDRFGDACELSVAGNTWTTPFVYDDSQMAGELEERVIEVVRRLSCYMTTDYSLSALEKDLVKDSKAYKYVRGVDLNWVMPHRGYDFLNMDVRNYVSYSETCFSVETRYDYKIIYRSVDPEIYPTAYRLYFQLVGDTWKLFDFTLI